MPQRARDLRAATLDAAARLLAQDGPSGLAIRKIAELADCSTISVYHYFHGKQGLLDALYVDGFTRLAAAQREVRISDDPEQDVRALCLRYRTTALDCPHHYQVMFGHPVPHFVPSPASRAHAKRTYQWFVDAVRRWSEQVCLNTDPGSAAHVLWAAGHGLMMLELTGNAPRSDREARYRLAVETIMRGLRA